MLHEKVTELKNINNEIIFLRTCDCGVRFSYNQKDLKKSIEENPTVDFYYEKVNCLSCGKELIHSVQIDFSKIRNLK